MSEELVMDELGIISWALGALGDVGWLAASAG